MPKKFLSAFTIVVMPMLFAVSTVRAITGTGFSEVLIKYTFISRPPTTYFSTKVLAAETYFEKIETLPIPTFIPSPTPTVIVTPTATPTPVPTQTPFIPTATPTLAPTPKAQPEIIETDPVKKFIMLEINNYRKSLGLPEVNEDPYTCQFAKLRAQEITSAFNHDGFRSRLDGKSLPYPTYSQVTENISLNQDYKDVVQKWIGSSGHAENMRKDTLFVCVERSGDYYAYEGWKP